MVFIAFDEGERILFFPRDLRCPAVIDRDPI